ncbi:hypothetical protein ULF88_25060 [Halopseudomonas pachastrellae]|nr:hypothetical protein [Halopseudomonas pachastrellae]
MMRFMRRPRLPRSCTLSIRCAALLPEMRGAWRVTPPSLAERLTQWHAIHYRAGSMALVLHGPQSSEQLLALAQSRADQLPTGRAPEPFALPLFADGHLPRQVDWQGRSSQAERVLLYPLSNCEVHGPAARWLCDWLNSPAPAGALGYLRERGLLDELQATLEADAWGRRCCAWRFRVPR